MTGTATIKPLFAWRAAIRDSARTPTERLVAHVLASYGDEWGRDIYPSIKRQAHDSGLGTTAVKTALASLKNDGWLSWEKRYDERGQTSNLYELLIPDGFIADPYEAISVKTPPVHTGHEVKTPPVHTDGVGEDTWRTGVRTPGAPLPLQDLSTAAAAPKRKKIPNKLYKLVGLRKLKVDGRIGGDALAVTIGRDDFQDEIASLYALHSGEWTLEQIAEVVKMESPTPYRERELNTDPGEWSQYDSQGRPVPKLRSRPQRAWYQEPVAKGAGEMFDNEEDRDAWYKSVCGDEIVTLPGEAVV